MTIRQRHILPIALSVLLLPSLLTGCKPTEQNYRRAYERAVENRREDADDNIYMLQRKQEARSTIKIGDNEIDVVTRHVSLTAPAKGQEAPPREMLKRYCVVAAQFKQLTNARSMYQRLDTIGFPAPLIVQTPEPYYYVVAGSYDNIDQAYNTFSRLKEQTSIVLRSPCPFILQPSGIVGRVAPATAP